MTPVLLLCKGKEDLAATAKSLQSCPTLCDSINSSRLGSPVPGILQARTLEWVAISFSRGSPDSGIKLMSPALAGGFFTIVPPGKPQILELLLLLLSRFRRVRLCVTP